MKYIWLNLKKFMKREPVIFTLAVLCITASVIVIHFSFGLYHHLKKKKLDDLYGTEEMFIGFIDESKTEVTKGKVVKLCHMLPQEILDRCYFSLEVVMPEEKDREDSLGATSLVFRIWEGRITSAPIEEELKESGAWLDGSWFTAEQVENGELVCIANPENMNYADPEDAAFARKYSKNENGKYVINGKEYSCIGHMEMLSMIPLVPVTTVEEEVFVQRMVVHFDHTIRRDEYETVARTVQGMFGEQVQIPKLAVPDIDSTRFYNTLTLLCVMMMLLSGIVLAVLFEYILLQRKKQLTIYRLCGLTLGRAKAMYYLECLIISAVSYVIAFLLFRQLLSSFLGRIFIYIEESYTLKSCGILGVLYMGIISSVLLVMINGKLERNIFTGYCRES